MESTSLGRPPPNRVSRGYARTTGTDRSSNRLEDLKLRIGESLNRLSNKLMAKVGDNAVNTDGSQPAIEFDDETKALQSRIRLLGQLATVPYELPNTTDTLRSVIEACPLALVTIGLEGTVMLWNPAAEQIFGWTSDEVLGHPAPYVPHADLAEHAQLLRATLDGETQTSVDVLRQVKGGSLIELSRSTAPLRDEQGNVRGLICIFADISERKRAEAEREHLLKREHEAREQAERAVRTRDEVLSIVAHDLRNPLHTIGASAFLIRDVPLSAEKKASQLEIIMHTTERMNRLIQDLLDVSKMEAGALVLEREHFSVHSVLLEAYKLLLPLAQDRGIELIHEPPEEVLIIAADRHRILQVFSNLVGNALKFTPSKGQITLTAKSAGDSVRFSVSDTGEGIPAESIAHLFERFWQAQKARKAGSGLGLAICKGIVEAHGGTIWADSQLGLGTTFYFTIPKAQSERKQPPPG